MNRCSTCRHWTPAKGKGIGTCDVLFGVTSDRGGIGVFAEDGEMGPTFHPIARLAIGTEAGFLCLRYEREEGE